MTEKFQVYKRFSPLKKSAIIALVFFCGFFSLELTAMPLGEQIVSGRVIVEHAQDITTIHASNAAIIHYYSFDVAQNETVQFIQPSSTSTVLNRIFSHKPTNINGSILSNGRVYIVNQMGVFIGSQAVINTGALYAIAGRFSDKDFRNNDISHAHVYSSVVNEGSINVLNDVILAGRHVENMGSILTTNGAYIVQTQNLIMINDTYNHLVAKLNIQPHQFSENCQGSQKVVIGSGDIYRLAIRRN